MANVRVPTWHQLPESVRLDLEDKRCGEAAFDRRQPMHRLGLLNIHAKLKDLGLWDQMDKILPPGPNDHPGQVEFIVQKHRQLQRNLDSRADFTDPSGDSKVKWHSREDANRCSVHFKQFIRSEVTHVHVHIDQFGVRWWDPIGLIQHLIYDVGPDPDGYADVVEVNRMLRKEGLVTPQPVASSGWSQPIHERLVAQRDRDEQPMPRFQLHKPLGSLLRNESQDFESSHGPDTEPADVPPDQRPGAGSFQWQQGQQQSGLAGWLARHRHDAEDDASGGAVEPPRSRFRYVPPEEREHEPGGATDLGSATAYSRLNRLWKDSLKRTDTTWKPEDRDWPGVPLNGWPDHKAWESPGDWIEDPPDQLPPPNWNNPFG